MGIRIFVDFGAGLTIYFWVVLGLLDISQKIYTFLISISRGLRPQLEPVDEVDS